MEDTTLNVQTVAVIGAGVSGVAAAIHLKRRGLNVTVYERNARAGGIWVYDERVSKDASYPSLLPSTGDSPEYQRVVESRKQGHRHDSPIGGDGIDVNNDVRPSDEDIAASFAPSGPCYNALKNNVSTIEMGMTCQSWKDGTEEFVPHHILADYIQDSASANDILSSISFNTRVNKVSKREDQWHLDLAQLVHDESGLHIIDSVQHFDGVVVASGHYHACNIPDIPGLSQWKARFPPRIRHSKLYRTPDEFKGQNVLLIGARVSSMDIARDIGTVARSVYQSSRGGMYDLPSHLLPANAARIGAVASFDSGSDNELLPDGSIPHTITLRSGRKLCGIHQVIICTGYHVSFPFLRQYHADGVAVEDADETVLVTDGQQTHNLHKDIWYIQDPTLAFIGVPYHVATFSLFEFSVMALAAVFAGEATLPSQEAMRKEYIERLQKKKAGRTFHSLKAPGDEIACVNELVELVNADNGVKRLMPMSGHSNKWREAYVRRGARQKILFSAVRDPNLDLEVLKLTEGC